MEPRKLVRLMSTINDAIASSNHIRALRLVLANFSHLEDTAVLRERVALILAERGRKKEAAEIYELVGRHYANVGFPSRAIAAAKQIQNLNPDTSVLLDHIATLYNIRSPFLSGEVQHGPMPEPETIEMSPPFDDASEEELVDRAVERSLDRDDMAAKPGRLPTIPLLSLLPEDTFRRALDFVEYEVFSRPQCLVKRGGVCDELLWTASDDLVVSEEQEKLLLPACALLGLSSFGRSGRPPEVDVFAQSGSEILRLRSEAIAQLSDEVSDFQNRLATLRRHAMTERLIRRHPMFEGLDNARRVEIIETFTGMRVSEGETIIEQGEASPGLFIVLDGEVDIVRKDEDWEITIATLKAGDVFGEMGLVADQPTVARCVMSNAGHLLHVPRDAFHALAQTYPSVARYTSNLARERMNEATLSANDLAEVE